MTGKPAPCCPECDEPLTWCIHGSGEAWDDHPAPRIGMKKDTAEELHDTESAACRAEWHFACAEKRCGCWCHDRIGT